MKIEENPNEIVNAWRSVIKDKRRMIFSFGERVEIRLSNIQEHIVKTRHIVDEWHIRECYFRDLDQYEYIDDDWRIISIGDLWGGPDISAFFKRHIQIPQTFAGERVALRFYVGGDSLLSINGMPYHGMDPFRNEVLLSECATGGELLNIEVESYVNWHSDEADNKRLHLAELVTIDPQIHDAYWDFRTAFKVLAIDDLDSELRSYLEYHLWDALRDVPPLEEDTAVFKQLLLQAQEKLHHTVFQSDRFQANGLMHLVGHSHLDLVFMWPYREYVRKIGRTHATMLRLMEQYPEFQFSQSMAKTYADMKHYFPEIYAQVKARIAEGRWEPIGAFWVEPDCNLISAESFVRQILHGQKFLEQEFGLRSRTCWQPDVFGMNASMPQILQRSGIDYVMTTKMTVWNDTNPWTRNTFWWEGIEGSRVLATVLPGHFIGMVDPDHMHAHWRDFSDKDSVGEVIYCYGWGDGGGGVDVEMLESARRYQRFMGLPALKFSGAEEALDSIRAQAEQVDIPVWRDEVYLEAHRGTATNKGVLKKYNRRGELLLREAEMLAALAWMDGTSYPIERLDAVWRDFLTTQFHDSLPGTHINEVYYDLLDEHEQIKVAAEAVREEAFAALARQRKIDLVGTAVSPKTAVIFFNSFLHPRSDPVAIPAELLGDYVVVDEVDLPFPHQYITSLGGQNYCLVQIPEIPPVGYRTLNLAPNTHTSTATSSTVSASPNTLENERIKAIFNSGGELISLWDKECQREVVAVDQTGNKFQLFEDIPGKYDAWDIVATYEEHEIDISGGASLSVAENGPIRASLRLEKTFGKSKIIQLIHLYAGSRRLVFETHIEWAERQRLLKVGFPVEVNTSFATHDIGGGNLKRPSHRNNSYDAAKFEVPSHKWIDLSQRDYGVSLMNDCKYGHDVHGQTMRLTLLKGSVYPDPHADLGVHDFTYALYPHPGSWEEANTIQKALNLNQPLLIDFSHELPEEGVASFIQCDAHNVTLEALKQSENGERVIVRLLEQHNCLTKATLIFERSITEAWSCDLMENREVKLHPEGQKLIVSLKPYELVTLCLDMVIPAQSVQSGQR